jgi:drug/metabolite transporter (DMT)-like permease
VLVKVRWLLMLLPFALWGTAMAAMKPLLVDAGPLTLAWMRLLPAGVVLLLAAWLWRGNWRVDRRDWLWLVLFALVDATAFQALLARSLFGDAINPVGWLGLLVGLLGILCLGLPAPLLRHWWLMGPEFLGEQAWSHGELWMLAAALAMALGTVISRYACRHSDAVAVTGWHMLLGALPLLAGSALLPAFSAEAPPFWPDWTLLQWGLMAYAALLGSAVAYGLFFWFANHGDLTSFTSLTFLTPVFALLCGVVLLEEQLEPLQWLGAAFALVSVVLINRRSLLWHPKGAAAEVVP